MYEVGKHKERPKRGTDLSMTLNVSQAKHEVKVVNWLMDYIYYIILCRVCCQHQFN